MSGRHQNIRLASIGDEFTADIDPLTRIAWFARLFAYLNEYEVIA